MLMGKQMLLAIFIIPVAFGAETEFQIRAVQLRPPANRAFMLGHPRIPLHFPPVFLPPFYLFGRHMDMVFAGYPKYYEVKQGSRHGEPAVSAALDKIGDEHNPIYDARKESC